MKIFNLGDMDWNESQLIYHALAYKNIEAIVLHSTKDNFVCLGMPQNPKDELDLKYCEEKGIKIFRREIGGGTVWLDKNQVFYSIILHRDNKDVPALPKRFFMKYLQPVIETCSELGLKAEYRPTCDLLVNGKKISGNGGGDIGDCKIMAGGLLIDFDYESMARVLQMSSDMRKKYLHAMKENMTTIKQEKQEVPSKKEIFSILLEKFEDFLGPMQEGIIDNDIKDMMKELDERYSSDDWLYQRGIKNPGREIKVREGVYLFEFVLDTQEGPVEIMCETNEEIVQKVTFPNSSIISSEKMKIIQDTLIGLEYDKRNIIYEISNVPGL